MQDSIDNVPIVDFHRVYLKYGDGPTVLKNLEFDLKKGSFHFVTGESGAGKTSLLSLMYLDQRPSSGRIQIFGQDLSQVPRSKIPYLRRRIGVVFQDFRLLNHLTTFENVALPLWLAGMKESEIHKRVNEMLMWVGLEKNMRAYPEVLSGGEKQRIAIARAVINRPDLLLADEPTGNVDDEMANRIMYLFTELNKQGTTLLIATHNQEIIRKNDKPRFHLSKGTLEYIPAPSQIYAAQTKGGIS